MKGEVDKEVLTGMGNGGSREANYQEQWREKIKLYSWPSDRVLLLTKIEVKEATSFLVRFLIVSEFVWLTHGFEKGRKEPMVEV